MKVKVAGKLYDVVEIKKSLGITHYCIEDEPNHYDWVNNVEVIEDDEIKEEERRRAMNMIYKYAVLPFATGDVRDAVNSGKWIAGELAESALMELSELKDKPNIAVRMTVVLEWPDETTIKKACEWLEENVSEYEDIYYDVGGFVSPEFRIEEFINDFKKAML